MAIKDKLSKMKMPERSMAAQDAALDLGMEPAEEDMMDEEEAMEMGEEMGLLEEYSDDELMQEIKKRGLSMVDMDEVPEDGTDMEEEDDEINRPEMVTGEF